MWGENKLADSMFRLSHPMFCEYWLCNSWGSLYICKWTSQGTCLVTIHFVWPRYMGSTKKQRHFTTASGLCPLGQSREREYTVSVVMVAVFGQERINASEVPKALWVFFQALAWCLAYPGFNEYCTQWDAKRQLVSWAGWRNTPRYGLCHLLMKALKSWWPVLHLISPCHSKGHLCCLNSLKRWFKTSDDLCWPLTNKSLHTS